MVKRLFYFAVGALALTACTSEDVVDVNTTHNLIRFENVVNRPTRAAEVTNSSLTHFNVTAYYTIGDNTNHAVFNNTNVNKVDGAWTYDGADRFWVPGAKYFFYAYSCGNLALGENYGSVQEAEHVAGTVETSELQISGYVSDNTHQHDLIFASNVGDGTGIVGLDSDNDDVALQFKHILTKLQAKFTNTFPDEYTVVVKNVTVCGIYNEADFNFVSGAWSDWAVKSTTLNDKNEAYINLASGTGLKVATTKAATEAVPAVGATETGFVIPENYADPESGKSVYIKFDVSVMYGDEEVISKTITGTFKPNWQAGYSYIYNVELNGNSMGLQSVVFTTSVVDEWGNDADEVTDIVLDTDPSKKNS